MPVPEEEGEKQVFDPQAFIRSYGAPFEQPFIEVIKMGDQPYLNNQLLGVLEDLIIEFDEVWGSPPETPMDASRIYEINAWCIMSLGHIPKPRFYQTWSWKIIRAVEQRYKDELYQEICVDLDYCNNKNNIRRWRLVSILAKFISHFMEEKMEALPEEAIAIAQMLTGLLAFFLMSTKFLDRLCDCK